MYGRGGYGGGGNGGCQTGGIRLVIALVIAGGSLCTYLSQRQVNPVTGETQSVALNPQQEIALGLQSAPEMARQFGGLDPDPRAQRAGELLAGVLGHEVGHVVGRHSAEQMAKQNLTKGFANAASVATTDPTDPRTYKNTLTAHAVAGLINLKYGRDDELQSDALGVRYMDQAGYDPRALISVMDVLEQAGGRSGGPEWTKSHPNPGNRRERIRQEIAKLGER